MSKTHRREGSELEYYRGIARQLKSENRQLKRRLSQLEKRAGPRKEKVESLEEQILTDPCPSCGKANLIAFDFGVRIFKKCSICGCQTIEKKSAEKNPKS